MKQQTVLVVGSILFLFSFLLNSFGGTVSMVQGKQFSLQSGSAPTLNVGLCAWSTDQIALLPRINHKSLDLQSLNHQCGVHSSCALLVNQFSCSMPNAKICSDFAATLHETCRSSQIFSLTHEQCVSVEAQYQNSTAFVMDFLGKSVDMTTTSSNTNGCFMAASSSALSHQQTTVSTSQPFTDSKRVFGAIVVVLFLLFVQL